MRQAAQRIALHAVPAACACQAQVTEWRRAAQGRVLEVMLQLGRFFARLKIDELQGKAEDVLIVKQRAAQLRCASPLLVC
jgi:hypothetical protein